MRTVCEIIEGPRRCDACGKTLSHIIQYLNSSKSKVKSTCPSCEHTSICYVAVYPNHPKKGIDKQVNYVVKNIKSFLEKE